jgi:hypothetical protein
VFAEAWIRERRTEVRVAPSVLARKEGNLLSTPKYPESKKVAAGPRGRLI